MIYLTSDLHGKFESLQRLLQAARFSEHPENQLYILGDVVDRSNLGGVDILAWIMDTPNVTLLMGNHEKMMLDAWWIFDENVRKNPDANMIKALERWKRNGADFTICALKAEDAAMREKIYAYVQRCPLYAQLELAGRRYVLVHGGLGQFEKGKALSEYSWHDLLWERPDLSTTYEPDAYTVIFGHTPTYHLDPKYKNRMVRTASWWNIDTGAASKQGHPMLLCLDTGEEYYVDED